MKKSSKSLFLGFLILVGLQLIWICVRSLSHVEKTGSNANSSGSPKVSPVHASGEREELFLSTHEPPMEAQVFTRERFSHTAREVIRSIPTVEDLQKLTTAQIHFTPEPLIRAGFQLGKIAQILHDNPTLAKEGISFYESCFHSEHFPTSVRALCFSNLKHLETQKDVAAEHSVPEEVKKLAAQL